MMVLSCPDPYNIRACLLNGTVFVLNYNDMWEGNSMKHMGWSIVFSLISLGGMVNNVSAQSFDLRNPNQSMFHVAQLHAIYAGLSQTINLDCGGDERAYADRFTLIADTLPDDLRRTYAGTFGEALGFGEAYGCDRQKLELFSGWENMYFQGITSR